MKIRHPQSGVDDLLYCLVKLISSTNFYLNNHNWGNKILARSNFNVILTRELILETINKNTWTDKK